MVPARPFTFSQDFIGETAPVTFLYDRFLRLWMLLVAAGEEHIDNLEILFSSRWLIALKSENAFIICFGIFDGEFGDFESLRSFPLICDYATFWNRELANA